MPLAIVLLPINRRGQVLLIALNDVPLELGLVVHHVLADELVVNLLFLGALGQQLLIDFFLLFSKDAFEVGFVVSGGVLEVFVDVLEGQFGWVFYLDQTE